MDTVSIASLLISIGGVITVIIALRKLPREERILTGGALEQYIKLLDKAAEREMAQQKRIDELQTRIEALETCQSELEEKVEMAEKNTAKFEGWAKRLCHQVQSLNGVPVPLEIAQK